MSEERAVPTAPGWWWVVVSATARRYAVQVTSVDPLQFFIGWEKFDADVAPAFKWIAPCASPEEVDALHAEIRELRQARDALRAAQAAADERAAALFPSYDGEE